MQITAHDSTEEIPHIHFGNITLKLTILPIIIIHITVRMLALNGEQVCFVSRLLRHVYATDLAY